MARTLSTTRLFSALQPELEHRLHAAPPLPPTTIALHTETGNAVVSVHDGRLDISGDAGSPGALPVSLPQYDLARLAFGTFPPGDVLARLAEPPAAPAAKLLEVLFPQRQPYLHLPDRV
jgi:hypothetical protein